MHGVVYASTGRGIAMFYGVPLKVRRLQLSHRQGGGGITVTLTIGGLEFRGSRGHLARRQVTSMDAAANATWQRHFL